jgi:hypothetical protein
MANEKGHLISAAGRRGVAIAMTALISAKTPPNQGVREQTELLKILAFRA